MELTIGFGTQCAARKVPCCNVNSRAFSRSLIFSRVENWHYNLKPRSVHFYMDLHGKSVVYYMQ